MTRQKIYRILLVLVLVFGVSAGAIVAYATHVDNIFAFKVNQSGASYGFFTPAATPDKQEVPDLIAAIGIDGTIGYVYESDLQEEMPRTPEEAVAYMQELEIARKVAAEKGEKYLRYIPLYDETGTKIIGQFGVEPINDFKN